ncbi:MAG: response regulator [Myxococcota bacterium]
MVHPLRGTILVADDNSLNRKLVTSRLRAQGYDVREVEDGRQALELALHIRPALIILDLVMPVMDGIQTARILRAAPKTRSIPILALSAVAAGTERESALTAGCNGFLAKPFRAEQLLAAVAELLRHAAAAAPPPFTDVPTTPSLS